MSSLNRDLVFQILQFLEKEKFEDTLHNLEKESGVFFNMKYFEEIVTNGELDKAENYLSGFTNLGDNEFSKQIFFEIRKQKYFEGLERGDNAKAVEILQKDLRVFASFKDDLVNKLTLLLSLENFRESRGLPAYGDAKAARAKLFDKLKRFIENNPLLRDKLQFPTLNNSRRRTLVTECLNLQLQLGKNPKPKASIKSVRADHTYRQPHGAQAPSSVTNPLMVSMPRGVPDMMPRIMDEPKESKIWKLTEITQPSQLRSLRLPDNSMSVKIVRLIYTNSGGAILALAYNAVHKLWKWRMNELNSTGKATTSVCPQLWQPSTGISMLNSTIEENLEDAVPCFALSKNDSYLMSASGGEISLFIMESFKTMATFMLPPPAATSIAFHPKDNNIIAVGMEDSSVQIYNVRLDEVKSKLKGHQKRVTSLAFSNVLNVLVSSGADAQLCVWSSDEWDKQASKFLEIPSGAFRRTPTPAAPTRVQFHQDQVHLLVVHETQIATYEAPKLECYKQWVPRYSSGSITDATYSCDGRLIYASFADGAVTILTLATLTMRCQISPTAYLPSNPSPRVYPLVIAAHPSEPNQFALGLTDGGVHVLEPLHAEGSWGVPIRHLRTVWDLALPPLRVT